MLTGLRIALIVPAFNEARMIERMLSRMPPYIDFVIVVDDASSDSTVACVEGVGDPRIELLRHEANLGVGRSIADGYRRGIDCGADLLVVMAGDDQMDPGDLPSLIAPVATGEVDYAKGDRFSHPDLWRTMPITRIAGGYVLSRLTGWGLGHASLRDSQCGFTVLSAKAARRLPIERLWPRYGYPNDLLGKLRAAGCRVRDVTVRPVYADETSGLRVRHLFVILWIIARATLEARRPAT